MPCRSYEDDSNYEVTRLRAQVDRLARIACAAMDELEQNEIVEGVLLKNEEVRDWWSAHKEADRKAREAEERSRRKAQLRESALKKLSPEEIKALGIKK